MKDMYDRIKFTIFAIALGGTLVSYAHNTFATKDIAQLILDRLDRIENKIDTHLIKR